MTIELSPREPRRHLGSAANSLRRRLIMSAAAVALLATGVIGAAALADTSAPTAPPAVAVANEPMSFAGIVQKVKPAVVSIRVKGVQNTAMQGFDEQALPPQLREFFRRFGAPFGDGNQGQDQTQQVPTMAEGSGFFISSDGYLVTNNHVIENADTVTVMTDDGQTYPAKVVGVDPKTDIALLKVDEGGPHPFVAIADSSPAVGDWVVAIGDPFGLGGTVTAGIISARGRDIGAGPYDDFLQVDAAINRGNSGGPDFNLAGQVVGVNTAIVTPSGGSVGVGFAIPAETVKSVVAALKNSGHVTRGFIGVAVQPVTADIASAMNLPHPSGALMPTSTRIRPRRRSGFTPATSSPRSTARR